MSGNLTAWEKVEIARSPNRPTALEYVDYIFDEFMELHGDRTSTDDKSMVCGLARIGEQNYTIVAEQKAEILRKISKEILVCQTQKAIKKV